MITAQDIREKTFEKAKFGGYEMSMVDDFLEELADDITASQKENAVLKSKMKVLVDKIEEYRANEDALNMAVFSAQKLAVQIEAEARQRAAAMLAEADAQVKARVGSIEEETARQEKKLADAKAATAKFFDGVRAMCNAQLGKLNSIGNDMGIQPETVQAAGQISADSVDDAIRSIHNSVSRIQPEPAITIDLPSEDNAPSAPEKGFGSTQPFNF